MSWISKNLTLDLLAIAIDGLNKSFDRIKSEPEPGTELTPAEIPEAQLQAVEPAPVEQPQPEPAPAPQPAAQEPASAPEPAAAPATEVSRLDEAKTHLRDISLSGGMDWITGTLFPHFGVNNLNDVIDENLPVLIDKAVAYKLEKGLN